MSASCLIGGFFRMKLFALISRESPHLSSSKARFYILRKLINRDSVGSCNIVTMNLLCYRRIQLVQVSPEILSNFEQALTSQGQRPSNQSIF